VLICFPFCLLIALYSDTHISAFDAAIAAAYQPAVIATKSTAHESTITATDTIA